LGVNKMQNSKSGLTVENNEAWHAFPKGAFIEILAETEKT